MANEKIVSETMKRIWGEDPEALISTHNLDNVGYMQLFSIKRIVEDIDPEAADNITSMMLTGLALLLAKQPWDLRPVCANTRLILEHAYNNQSTPEDRLRLEAYVMAKAQLLEETRIPNYNKNKKKGFKWENLPEFYA